MALKTITGKVIGPDNNARGLAQIKARLSQPATIPGTAEVLPVEVAVQALADGTYSIQLHANNDLTPNGTFYTILEEGGVSQQFTVVVPTSAGPFVMSQIMAAAPTPAPPAALDSAVVHIANPETIVGAKTFQARQTLLADVVHSYRTATEAELVSGLDASLAETVYVNLTVNRVMAAPINPAAGQRMKVVFTQPAGGNCTVTLPAAVSAPAWTLNLGASAITELNVEYNGTTSKWVLALNPPAGAYGATTSVIVGPTQVNLQIQGGDMSGAAFSDAAFTAAKALLPNGAGVIGIPPGVPKFASPLALTVAGSSIQGSGRSATVLNYASTTADLITIAADGCAVRGVNLLRAGGVATAGSGIKLTSGKNAILDDLIVNGFFYNISALDAYGWALDRAYMIEAVQYQLYVRDTAVPDRGDSSIGPGVVFDSSVGTPSAIRWESGGGLRIMGPKILHHAYGIDLQIADGATTGDLNLVAASIESQTTAGIRLGRLGTTGVFKRIAIGAIQMLQGAGTDGIVLQAGVDTFSIGGGSVLVGNSAQIGIDVQTNVNFGYVDGVHFDSFGTGVKLSSGSGKVSIGVNNYRNVAVPIEDNTPQNLDQAPVTHDYRSRINAVTSTVTYSNYFTIDQSNYRGARIELVMEGLLGSVGNFRRSIVALLGRDAGNCTVTTVSDTAAGAVVDVQFDVTTTAGSVIIGVRRNAAAGGTQLDGPISLRIFGHSNKIHIL